MILSELQAHPGSFQNNKTKEENIGLTPSKKNRKTMGGQTPVILSLYFVPIIFLFSRTVSVSYVFLVIVRFLFFLFV